MYVVYCGDTVIHDPQLGDKNTMLFAPVLTKEVNKADSFIFTIYPSNPGYASLTRLTPGLISVYDGEELIFRGRILNDEKGWYNQLTVTCESDFAMLNDSVVRPYSFTGTVLAYLTQMITQHNSQAPVDKQFTVGSCTVIGNITRGNSNYPNTMTELQDKLVGMLGGYLRVRRSGSTNYIDYLSDSQSTTTQTVELGKNLLSIAQTRKGEDIVTGIIPLGAKDEETEERLTIKSVNSNQDYLENSSAVSAYGKIYTTVVWDDVTDAATLKSLGQAKLAELTATVVSIELTAADLHQVDASIEDFAFFDYVTVNDTAHNLVGSFLISKKTIDLASPANTKITLGKTTTQKASERASQTQQVAIKAAQEYGAGVSQATMNAAIKAATDLIKGTNGGYLKFHYDQTGNPTELLIMNASTEAAATKIWRWNMNGLGFSNDGGETYTLAMTSNGQIVADFITAGILQGIQIIAEEGSVGGWDINEKDINKSGTYSYPASQYDIIDVSYVRSVLMGYMQEADAIRQNPQSDINGDGHLDKMDIAIFMNLILGFVARAGSYTCAIRSDNPFALIEARDQNGAAFSAGVHGMYARSAWVDRMQMLDNEGEVKTAFGTWGIAVGAAGSTNGVYNGAVEIRPEFMRTKDSNSNVTFEVVPETGLVCHSYTQGPETVYNPQSGWGDGTAITLPAGTYVIVASAKNGGNYAYVRGRMGIKVNGSEVIHADYAFNGADANSAMQCVYTMVLTSQATAQATCWVPENAGYWSVTLNAIRIG